MVERGGMFGGGPYQVREGYRWGIQQIPRALYHCEVPVVAAVNGPAVGAGCDLAVMCDLRVASSTAWFAESFVQLGIIPGDGGARSEEHTSELQSRGHLVCRLLLEKKNKE